MATIGIMGGTFNPIHKGHVALAKAAKGQYPIERIWFMPNRQPEYKDRSDLVSVEDRMNMVQLAISDNTDFELSDYEIRREGSTYTVDTLRGLHRQYPSDTFYFIMGADSLFEFEKWREADTIAMLATILAAPRDEKNMDEITDRIHALNDRYGQEVFHALSCPVLPCSSSEIREALYAGHGEMIRRFLPDAVYFYIKAHGLYGFH